MPSTRKPKSSPHASREPDTRTAGAATPDAPRGLDRRIRWAHLLVLLTGAALSALVFDQGREISRRTGELTGRDMPAIELLSQLGTDVLELEPILYEYYLTTDQARFKRRYEDRSRRVEAALRQAHAAFAQRSEIDEIAALHRSLSRRAHDLDATLREARVDWDAARDVLADVPAMAEAIEQRVERLVVEVRDDAVGRGDIIRREVNTTTTLVVAFSTVLVLVTLIVGHYVNAYLAELAERKRLAMFPERAPNPVLSLGWHGELRYANPGARAQAAVLFGAPPQPQRLLPADLPARLASMQAAARHGARWIYERRGRWFEGHVHWLGDLGTYHVYLLDITEQRRAQALVEHRALHHSLTDLPNRRAFMAGAAQFVHPQAAPRTALVQLAVDRFGSVIGQFGHPTGDRFLVAVAARLQDAVEHAHASCCPHLRLFHFDGERFALLVPELADTRALEDLLRHLARCLEQPLEVGGIELGASISAGAAVFPLHGTDVVTLLRHAETAMQAAQQRAPGSFRCYDDALDAANRDRLALERALRQALAREQLSLVYQPQIALADGRVVACEALLRWQHPSHGSVSPMRFIPLAEETGLIGPIGEWVLRRACAELANWHARGLAELRVAVNVSAVQLQQPGFADRVARVLEQTGVAPERLELEVTEGVMMHGAERGIHMLEALRALGVRLSIDDFGTGYSSLAYLQRFALDQLKVDKSFVRLMDRDPGSAAIARAVVALGRTLGLEIVAEGVENPAQLAMLRQMGCDLVQGFVFSKPLDPAALLDFARRAPAPARASGRPAIRAPAAG